MTNASPGLSLGHQSILGAALLLVALFLPLRPSAAQEETKVDGFFERDFVGREQRKEEPDPEVEQHRSEDKREAGTPRDELFTKIGPGPNTSPKIEMTTDFSDWSTENEGSAASEDGSIPILRTNERKPGRAAVGVSISAVMQALPRDHLVWSLRRLSTLENQLKVPIREVVILGGSNDFGSESLATSDLAELTRSVKAGLREKGMKPDEEKIFEGVETIAGRQSLPAKIITKLKLTEPEFIGAREILRRLGVKNLPAWVIHTGDADHVFEGDYDPIELFGVHGEFIGGELP